MNNIEQYFYMVETLENVRSRMINNAYWSEPCAFGGEVQNIEDITKVLTSLGKKLDDRAGTRPKVLGEDTNYVIICDHPELGIRLFDLDENDEFDFDTEYEFAYWCEHGERPQDVNGDQDANK